MKNSILTFITLFSLTLLMNCGGEKGKENQAEAGTESAENTETETSQSNLDFAQPCSWLEADFVKSTFELDVEVKSKVPKYPENTCRYEWEKGEGLDKKYGQVDISFDKETVFESAEKAEKSLQVMVEYANKGVKTEVETNQDTEKVMEGSENDADGKVEVNFQMKYVRVDKEAGFPAAFYAPNPESALSHTLMFVINSRIMSIQINFYNKDVELIKKYAIALAKKIRGE